MFQQQAQEYLANSSWELGSAITEYFNRAEGIDEEAQAPDASNPPSSAPQPMPPSSRGFLSSPATQAPKKKFATLGDLSGGRGPGHAGHGHGGGNDDDDDARGQGCRFFFCKVYLLLNSLQIGVAEPDEPFADKGDRYYVERGNMNLGMGSPYPFPMMALAAPVAPYTETPVHELVLSNSKPAEFLAIRETEDFKKLAFIYRSNQDAMDEDYIDKQAHVIQPTDICHETCNAESAIAVYYVGQGSGHRSGEVNIPMLVSRDGSITHEWTILSSEWQHISSSDVVGDSGAWVIRKHGNRLMGQVLAYSAGQVLFTPIDVIFADLKNH
ncbi:hypothetical protein HO133_009628 [Letharia lupina]|uniref:Uncharacterized protein n=1 Tax=Letharia lupina TaxID=560253 RepID=A0A8H6CLB0_9LECA|nr:uncharacterized protein HO133_009628 [Letharia lupina]KAF6225628.1 hypothetical protein HO133_009628 [Letharia lupina]